jgi:hypothetical protein
MASKAERETILRWDAESGTATVYTADPATKRRLERRGYQFRELSPGSWQAEAPKRAITLRRLPLKAGTRAGRPFPGQKPLQNGALGETTSD